jgi:hypothetical protein
MSKKILAQTTLFFLAGLSLAPYDTADAQVKCYQAANKVVRGKVVTQLKAVTRPSKCKKGEVLAQAGAQGPTGPQGATGLTGSTGPAGADGSLRVYGDGSADAREISTNTTLADSNLMYTDFTVNAGSTLTVPSGTVIRCTGQFLNQGTIAVSPGTLGGNYPIFVGDSPPYGVAPAHPGISNRAAGLGAYGNRNLSQRGGDGGVGLTEVAARALRYPGANAGGAGGGASSPGGGGGGSLTVLCQNGITNEGTIEADGRAATGGGGGGGGVIILASATSVTSSAGSVISANGASGAAATTSTGGGGAGGGGIIHLMAPTVTTAGATISVQGGPGAETSASVTSSPRFAGGGGGASGGNGSDGATMNDANFSQNTQGGDAGRSLISLLDPTPLF